MPMRTFFLAALLVMLGAGCAAPKPPAPAQGVEDATPHVNEENCAKSGGTVDGDACDCPAGYDPDPAGFCLDAQGHPGASIPKP